MVIKRAHEPFKLELPAAIVLTLITSLGSVFGAYYALKSRVEAAESRVVRQDLRMDRLEANQASENERAAQSHADSSVIANELKNLNAKVLDTNDRLGRIEDRQVRIIVPAVTNRSR